MVVRWRKSALKELQAAYDYIKERSHQAADKVRTEIIEHTEELTKHPEIHSLDKYKVNNDGTYRYFEMHKYRIAYRVTKGIIRIYRVKHTMQSPLYY